MSTNKTANYKFHSWIGTDYVLRTEFNDNFNTIDAKMPERTTANITLYVATTGNDANDGLTLGTPLRNIQTAVSRVPQIVNHAVTINVAAGTYTENITVSGFMGYGSINIVGDSVVSALYNVTRMLVVSNKVFVNIAGIRATLATDSGFYIRENGYVMLNNCSIVSPGGFPGFYFINSGTVITIGCMASNRSAGLSLDGQVQATSINWQAGTGNTIGISCSYGKVSKNGIQPSGTTAESAGAGGQIL